MEDLHTKFIDRSFYHTKLLLAGHIFNTHYHSNELSKANEQHLLVKLNKYTEKNQLQLVDKIYRSTKNTS